jgi:hypothetical protein
METKSIWIKDCTSVLTALCKNGLSISDIATEFFAKTALNYASGGDKERFSDTFYVFSAIEDQDDWLDKIVHIFAYYVPYMLSSLKVIRTNLRFSFTLFYFPRSLDKHIVTDRSDTLRIDDRTLVFNTDYSICDSIVDDSFPVSGTLHDLGMVVGNRSPNMLADFSLVLSLPRDCFGRDVEEVFEERERFRLKSP